MSAALSLEYFQAQAAGLSYRNQAFIDGKYVPPASGKTFDCINPATGKVLTKVAACDKEDVDRAVKAARAAFEKGAWANMAPADRKKILIRFAELIDQAPRRAGAARDARHGQAHRDARSDRHSGLGQCIRWYAEAIDKIYDEVAPTGPRPSRLITPRADRRRGRRRAVELPAADGVLEDRPGARRRQLRHPEARRAVAAHRHPPRRAGGRGRHPRRRASTSCPASARRRARRSAATWTSTASPSPARPRSASTSCATPARAT